MPCIYPLDLSQHNPANHKHLHEQIHFIYLFNGFFKTLIRALKTEQTKNIELDEANANDQLLRAGGNKPVKHHPQILPIHPVPLERSTGTRFFPWNIFLLFSFLSSAVKHVISFVLIRYSLPRILKYYDLICIGIGWIIGWWR